MGSKRDVRSYLNVVSENVKKDSRISIPEIIISASDDVSWGVLACNFIKDELFHKYFSGIFPRRLSSFCKMSSNFHETIFLKLKKKI